MVGVHWKWGLPPGGRVCRGWVLPAHPLHPSLEAHRYVFKAASWSPVGQVTGVQCVLWLWVSLCFPFSGGREITGWLLAWLWPPRWVGGADEHPGPSLPELAGWLEGFPRSWRMTWWGRCWTVSGTCGARVGRREGDVLLAGSGGFSLRTFRFSLIELLVRAPELCVFFCLK